MTENNQPDDDGVERGDEFDPATDPRDWSAATSELACFALARSKGKKLVKIINTGKKIFPIICIFEEYSDG